ncbi:hypothetical protein CRE_20910 [Caenorhabditis remanei]|uniref:Uncharacterized protein n=1 Tax=Caenorhabditis remanei TaxID=31234 RepID=E3N3R4_CAERE|nr:hypothetical protein CRE_20910 [Caenorhabditis remanei]
MWPDNNAPFPQSNYSKLVVPPSRMSQTIEISMGPAGGRFSRARNQVPPMSSRRHRQFQDPILDDAEEEPLDFVDPDGSDEDFHAIDDDYRRAPVASESRMSRRITGVHERSGTMEQRLRGFQNERPAVQSPPAATIPPTPKEIAEAVREELHGHLSTIDQLTQKVSSLQMRMGRIDNRVTLNTTPHRTGIHISGYTKWSPARRFLGAHVIVTMSSPAANHSHTASYLVFNSYAKQTVYYSARTAVAAERKAKMMRKQEAWMKEPEKAQLIRESVNLPPVVEGPKVIPPYNCQCIAGMLYSTVLHDNGLQCASRRLFQTLAIEIHHQLTMHTLQELKSLKFDWIPPMEQAEGGEARR